jgi:hypothetical protein
MTIVVDGTYEGDGVVKLEKPIDLEKKARVHVIIESRPAPAEDGDPTGWQAARRFIGMWKDAPARGQGAMSEDHDDILYKRR